MGSPETYGVIINVFIMESMDTCLFTWGSHRQTCSYGFPRDIWSHNVFIMGPMNVYFYMGFTEANVFI